MAADPSPYLRQLLAEVRTKHHPHFAKLEDAMRAKYPNLVDDFLVGLAVVQLLDLVDMAERESLEDTNPGLARVQ